MYSITSYTVWAQFLIRRSIGDGGGDDGEMITKQETTSPAILQTFSNILQTFNEN